MSGNGFHPVGSGLTVYEDERAIEGPVVWLDSPKAVLDFVASGRAGESIVLARGGTTTFLTPALTAGVKGVMTLQGAPESHLGILCREYGIPCLMSVAFEEGVHSSRGETIPADGVRVRLDVSSTPTGQVFVQDGAPVEANGAVAEVDAEQAEQIRLLIERYQGEVPHGSEGDREFRKRLTTGVLELTEESLRRDLTRTETNDLLRYLGWNFWDFLAARATEGESGLIPRQEYEALSCLQVWQRYPELQEFITREVGVDGLYDIGATARHEIGSKINLVHVWVTGVAPAFGRGITLGLGLETPEQRFDEVGRSLQFMRRLYHGVWGGGPLFSSMREYRAPLLDSTWLERFMDERIAIEDPEQRARFQRFSAGTELLGFLLHFDNRCGLADTGPYPLPDGGFMIVRDHFLHDDLYHWADVADGLPHAITQAMFFTPDEPMTTALMDGSTLFTKPANYLRHLSGMAVYVRDRWDTPVEDVRRIDEAEMERILQAGEVASNRLYSRIASMPKRDKVMAGAQVYYTEFIAPIARRAGLWDRLVDEFDFYELEPLVANAYYPLVRDGEAAELVPRLFITGQGFPPLEQAAGDGAVDPGLFPALHAARVQGIAKELPGDVTALEAAGMVAVTDAGIMLTEAGHAQHARLLERERATLDHAKLAAVYDRFLAVNRPLKALSARWQAVEDQAAQLDLAAELDELLERVQPALRRTIELLPRFGGYATRLQEAALRVRDGAHDYVTSPLVDSIHTIWMELHEDYLLTLGRSREAEGSY